MTIERIQSNLAQRLNVPLGVLISRRGDNRTAFARQLGYYLCRKRAAASFPRIGESFGRNHSPIIYGVRAITGRMENCTGLPAYRQAHGTGAGLIQPGRVPRRSRIIIGRLGQLSWQRQTTRAGVIARLNTRNTNGKRSNHMSLNRVTIIGHLGQDPQLRFTPQGNPVCTLSIATDESYTNKETGERKEAVEWHRVIVWGKQGTNCSEMLTKGRQLYVEGRLRTHSYDKDGQKHYATEIIAQRVQFLGPKPNGGVTEIDQALPADGEAPF